MEAKDWDKLATPTEYYSEILSPLEYPKSKRQLCRALRKHASKNKQVLDLGCGLGRIIPYLSTRFKHVTAIDFSPEMVSHAKMHARKNTTVEQADMRNLRAYKHFDVVLSINSILAPSIPEADHILKQIKQTLKNRGTLIAVLPSMDSAIYVAMLVYEQQLRQTTRQRAKTRTKHIIGQYDYLRGLFTEDGTQKFYYNFEILYRLKKAGFHKITIEKLHYPWSALENYHMNFPRQEQPWDWLVTARTTQ